MQHISETVYRQRKRVGNLRIVGVAFVVIGDCFASMGEENGMAIVASRLQQQFPENNAGKSVNALDLTADYTRGARMFSSVVIGSALGIALTFGLSRLVRAAGGAGSLFDPPWPAFVIPVAIVVIAAILATWIPARRALRVNPASLLKAT